jgi:tRNA(adenine34) deaminase
LEDRGGVMQDHSKYMQMALQEAKNAGQNGEVPIGAILVSESGETLGRGANSVIRHADPTAHAEMLAIREASRHAGNYRLTGTRLYVTIEPCIMCMGAVIHARVHTLIFGAPDPKWGAAGSLIDFSQDRRLNHQVVVVAGVMENRCRDIMQDFFRSRRNNHHARRAADETICSGGQGGSEV